MTFKFYEDNRIKISLFQKIGGDGSGINFVATYPNEDIWEKNDICQLDDIQKFCFRKELSRSKWAEEMGYKNHTQAILDFKDAIYMFNKGNFGHSVTKYFLNLMLTAIGLNKNK